LRRAESEAARDGAFVGGFAQAGGFGGSRGRHELPRGGAAVRALRERGSYAPLPMGGDTRSQRLEAHADFLLGLHRREPDLTLNEICDRLELGRGEKVSASMIWRFFDRRDITFKKNPRTRASRTARTSLDGDGDGSRVNSTSIR
jgi:transposase